MLWIVHGDSRLFFFGGENAFRMPGQPFRIGPNACVRAVYHFRRAFRTMLTLSIRETLMRELHTRRVSVDQLASYLLMMDNYDAREVASLPCPRCYATGVSVPMLVVAVNGEIESLECERCSASYEFRKGT